MIKYKLVCNLCGLTFFEGYSKHECQMFKQKHKDTIFYLPNADLCEKCYKDVMKIRSEYEKNDLF